MASSLVLVMESSTMFQLPKVWNRQLQKLWIITQWMRMYYGLEVSIIILSTIRHSELENYIFQRLSQEKITSIDSHCLVIFVVRNSYQIKVYAHAEAVGNLAK